MNSLNTERPVPSVLKPLLVVTGYLAAHLALYQVTVPFRASGTVSPWYPLSGLSLTLPLTFGLQYSPAILLAALLSDLLLNQHPPSLPVSLTLALIQAGGYGLAAAGLRRALRADPQLRWLRNAGRFVLVALAAPIAIVGLAAPILRATGIVHWPDLLPVTLNLWIGDVACILVLVPLLLAFVAPMVKAAANRPGRSVESAGARKRRPASLTALETLGQATAILLVFWLVSGTLPASKVHFLYLCFLPLIWIALRHGLPGTAIGVLAIGVGTMLMVQYVGPVFGDPVERHVFVAVLSLAGLSMGTFVTERVQTEETLQRRNLELALLNRASRTLTSTLDLDQVLATLLEEMRRLLGAVACSVWLIDPRTGELVCRQATGPKSEIVRGWRLAPGEGFAGWVARHGKSLIVPDALADERHFRQVDQQTGLILRSILTVPLRIRTGVIGVLQVVDTEANRFGEADLALLEPLGATAAIAIENARLYEQARQDAETKSVLLREVNHRVKNILTAIIGLLQAEQRRARGKERGSRQAALKELVNRVRGLATVHTMLSTSEWRPLLLSELATQVIRSTLQTLPRDRRVVVKATPSPVRVTPEQAHNLALVLNELVTNTVKHAMRERDAAHIAVGISLDGRTVTLEVRDDGPGYPEEVLEGRQYGAGFDLVKSIVRKSLGGELLLYNDHGAVTAVRFEATVKEEGENGK